MSVQESSRANWATVHSASSEVTDAQGDPVQLSSVFPIVSSRMFADVRGYEGDVDHMIQDWPTVAFPRSAWIAVEKVIRAFCVGTPLSSRVRRAHNASLLHFWCHGHTAQALDGSETTDAASPSPAPEEAQESYVVAPIGSAEVRARWERSFGVGIDASVLREHPVAIYYPTSSASSAQGVGAFETHVLPDLWGAEPASITGDARRYVASHGLAGPLGWVLLIAQQVLGMADLHVSLLECDDLSGVTLVRVQCTCGLTGEDAIAHEDNLRRRVFHRIGMEHSNAFLIVID